MPGCNATAPVGRGRVVFSSRYSLHRSLAALHSRVLRKMIRAFQAIVSGGSVLSFVSRCGVVLSANSTHALAVAPYIEEATHRVSCRQVPMTVLCQTVFIVVPEGLTSGARSLRLRLPRTGAFSVFWGAPHRAAGKCSAALGFNHNHAVLATPMKDIPLNLRSRRVRSDSRARHRGAFWLCSLRLVSFAFSVFGE